MTDRELIQKAAKAAGHKALEWHREIPREGGISVDVLYVGQCEAYRPFRPLDDDGDALRLAVDLQMDVYVRAEWVEAVAPMGAPQKLRYGLEGPRVAARRAITCAAAAMPARRVLGAA